MERSSSVLMLVVELVVKAENSFHDGGEGFVDSLMCCCIVEVKKGRTY